MDEYYAIATRYKEQVVEYREKIRSYEEAARSRNDVESDLRKLVSEMDALGIENQSLKSQLFDRMQVEQRLRDQLSSGGASVGGGDEIRRLKESLTIKEAENKELADICNNLLAQLEAAKQGHSS